MTHEGEASLARARRDLDEARMIAALPLARVAARSGYYADFHAAEAFIVVRSGKIAKTHRGVHSEFVRLVKDHPEDDRKLGRTLMDGYRYKELADYSTDPDAVVTDADAAEIIEAAAHFVARVTELVKASPAPPKP